MIEVAIAFVAGVALTSLMGAFLLFLDRISGVDGNDEESYPSEPKGPRSIAGRRRFVERSDRNGR